MEKEDLSDINFEDGMIDADSLLSNNGLTLMDLLSDSMDRFQSDQKYLAEAQKEKMNLSFGMNEENHTDNESESFYVSIPPLSLHEQEEHAQKASASSESIAAVPQSPSTAKGEGRKRKPKVLKASTSTTQGKDRTDKTWWLESDKNKLGWELDPEDYTDKIHKRKIKKWKTDRKHRLEKIAAAACPKCLGMCDGDMKLFNFMMFVKNAMNEKGSDKGAKKKSRENIKQINVLAKKLLLSQEN